MTLIKMVGKNHKIVWEKKKKIDVMLLSVLIAMVAFAFFVIAFTYIFVFETPVFPTFVISTLGGITIAGLICIANREEVYIISLLYKDKVIATGYEIQTDDRLNARGRARGIVNLLETKAMVRENQERDIGLQPGEDGDQKVFEGL